MCENNRVTRIDGVKSVDQTNIDDMREELYILKCLMVNSRMMLAEHNGENGRRPPTTDGIRRRGR